MITRLEEPKFNHSVVGSSIGAVISGLHPELPTLEASGLRLASMLGAG